KIVLTGGGTGGHFYPLIAVAEEIRNLIREKKLITAKLYYLADKPFDQESLKNNDLIFIKIRSGKIRRYFSVRNFFDPFLLLWGITTAIWKLYWIYPD